MGRHKLGIIKLTLLYDYAIMSHYKCIVFKRYVPYELKIAYGVPILKGDYTLFNKLQTNFHITNIF